MTTDNRLSRGCRGTEAQRRFRAVTPAGRFAAGFVRQIRENVAGALPIIYATDPSWLRDRAETRHCDAMELAPLRRSPPMCFPFELPFQLQVPAHGSRVGNYVYDQLANEATVGNSPPTHHKVIRDNKHSLGSRPRSFPSPIHFPPWLSPLSLHQSSFCGRPSRHLAFSGIDIDPWKLLRVWDG